MEPQPTDTLSAHFKETEPEVYENWLELQALEERQKTGALEVGDQTRKIELTQELFPYLGLTTQLT